MLIIEIENIVSLSPETFVDLDQYSGKWYIIAAIPKKIEKNRNFMTESYIKDRNGNMTVYNTYVRRNKMKVHSFISKGFPQKGTNNFKWKTQLLWPFKRKYIIEELPEDYSYAVVGDPNKRYLHILSRSNFMNIDQYLEIVKRCKARGYDISKLKRIPQ